MRLSLLITIILSCSIGLAAETTNTWVRNSGCTGIGLAPLATDNDYIELFVKSDSSNTATVYAITFKAVRVGCLEYEQE